MVITERIFTFFCLQLQHFVNTWFTASNCAVVATGVPFSQLSDFVSSLEINTKDKTTKTAKYHGGQIRKERDSELSNVAVVVEVAGLDKEKDALACAILQRAIGSGPRVKWGNSPSPLYKAVSTAKDCGNQFAISAFNATYSDSGLFGFILFSVPDIAGSVSFNNYNI
jgi:ubiquinol-cytochrome c reductase core subunit 2